MVIERERLWGGLLEGTVLIAMLTHLTHCNSYAEEISNYIFTYFIDLCPTSSPTLYGDFNNSTA